MMRGALVTICILLWSVASALGQSSYDQPFTIVDAINSADGTIYIYQPQALDALVSHDGSETSEADDVSKRAGYRVQIFSDNNIRTAKANAEHRKTLVEQQTEWRAYITFDSPYWRVRVGDFNTQAEANAALHELKSMFPTMADDMRLVKERINDN